MSNTKSKNQQITTIIWDWNGTLINDTSICIEAMNQLLVIRNMQLLNKDIYQEKFTFPVKDYYENIGFDFKKEPFEKPALEFIDNYHALLPNAKLFNEVNTVLAGLKHAGYKMIILSAMEEESLKKSVNELGIGKYFDAIVGINNHFAKSKIERGKFIIKQMDIELSSTILIGDTLHDKEVADEIGCNCILVANGHQSHSRLSINGNVVSHSLSEVSQLIAKM